MRLLCVSDIHSAKQNVLLLKERLRGQLIDAIIVAGDVTSHGSEFAAEEILKELKHKGKVFAIPGNLDTIEVMEMLENKNYSLHNKLVVFENHSFAGYGGSLKGNAGHILSTDKQIEKALEKILPEDCSNLILVTHLPPFGTSLDNAGGKHIGSKAIKKVIEQKQPLLHICGHAHDSFGEELFGKTISINVAALKEGRAVLVDINGKINIERILL